MIFEIEIDDDLIPYVCRTAIKREYTRIPIRKGGKSRRDCEDEAVREAMDDDSESKWTDQQIKDKVRAFLQEHMTHLLFCWTHHEAVDEARAESRKVVPNVEKLQRAARVRGNLATHGARRKDEFAIPVKAKKAGA